jgi:DNA-binding response OmpR family regulator
MFFNSAEPRQVLIVEDEPLVGLALKDCFERSGARVLWVKSDQAAYIVLDAGERRFDLLVLDVDLGRGTTGFDVARYARRLNDKVGIIFSSGSPPDWLGAFGVDGAMFVPKPCTEASMLAAAEIVCSPRDETARPLPQTSSSSRSAA